VHYWNTKRQGFLPECEGFRLNSAYGLPIQGSFVEFAPRGICSRVFGSSKFPNTFKEKQDSRMQHMKKIITVQAQNSKVLYLLPIFKHP
jgi:hypothetical protein